MPPTHWLGRFMWADKTEAAVKQSPSLRLGGAVSFDPQASEQIVLSQEPLKCAKIRL
jgi:hypothetical protein